MRLRGLKAGQAGCGVIYAKSEFQDMNVSVRRGHVSCTQARQVLSSFFSGHGVQHGGPSEAALYWTLPGGWRCQLATGGGGGCGRGGKPPAYLNPPELIIASPVIR